MIISNIIVSNTHEVFILPHVLEKKIEAVQVHIAQLMWNLFLWNLPQ